MMKYTTMMALVLSALPLLAEEEEQQGSPELFTATVVPGGTKNYTNPAHWDTGEVPSGYHANVHVDGDSTVETKLDIVVPQNVSFTNGLVTVDADDSLIIRINDKAGNPHSWYTTCITNNGSFEVSGSNGKNDQNLHVYALEAPSYFGPDSVTKVSDGRQGCTHSIQLMTDGTVNDGFIEATVSGAQYLRTYLYFKGDGTLTNNGFIDGYTTGNYTSTKPGDLTVGFYGNVAIEGTGILQIDNDRRSPGATFGARIMGNGWNSYFTNGVHHTIQGNGYFGDTRICNYGLIRSLGTNSALTVSLTGRREHHYTVTNNVTGRLVANGPAGMELKYNSRPGWNTQFVNLGLLEARAGSFIKFGDGVNSTSTHEGDSNLSTTTADYLKLDGRVAGGGAFRTIRPIHIMDGAKLMPGDLANDDGTGESTCGQLTMSVRSLVLEEGAITEFQCRKPVAGKYDSIWVDGDATIAGTFKFLEKAGSGTYPLVTSTGTLTCDLKTLKIECAQGVTAPKLKLVESTYPVEEEVGVVDGEGNPVMDAESGLQVTETKTVDYPCQVLEATWLNGFTIMVR